MMKKKVTVIVVILIVIILIGAGVMWRMRRTEAEGSSLGDNQKYVYAYVSSIEGNEMSQWRKRQKKMRILTVWNRLETDRHRRI